MNRRRLIYYCCKIKLAHLRVNNKAIVNLNQKADYRGIFIVDGKAIVTHEVFRNYDVSTVWLCDGWGNLPML